MTNLHVLGQTTAAAARGARGAAGRAAGCTARGGAAGWARGGGAAEAVGQRCGHVGQGAQGARLSGCGWRRRRRRATRCQRRIDVRV